MLGSSEQLGCGARGQSRRAGVAELADAATCQVAERKLGEGASPSAGTATHRAVLDTRRRPRQICRYLTSCCVVFRRARAASRGSATPARLFWWQYILASVFRDARLGRAGALAHGYGRVDCGETSFVIFSHLTSCCVASATPGLRAGVSIPGPFFFFSV